MSKENEAHRDWRVAPSTINDGTWWAAGYTYEGNQGRRQGEFVPCHHWAGRMEAQAYCNAMLDGCSRDEAKQRVMDA